MGVVPFYPPEGESGPLSVTNICNLAGRAGWFALMEVDMIAILMGAHSSTHKSLRRTLCSLYMQTLTSVAKEYGKKVDDA